MQKAGETLSEREKGVWIQDEWGKAQRATYFLLFVGITELVGLTTYKVYGIIYNKK